jgi:hypothetical protein
MLNPDLKSSQQKELLSSCIHIEMSQECDENCKALGLQKSLYVRKHFSWRGLFSSLMIWLPAYYFLTGICIVCVNMTHFLSQLDASIVRELTLDKTRMWRLKTRLQSMLELTFGHRLKHDANWLVCMCCEGNDLWNIPNLWNKCIIKHIWDLVKLVKDLDTDVMIQAPL